ncbi:MAG: hypothetical protein MJZ33_10385 [Paludibacteraceae bacterium]|nr:hypothetical protein [Paludibacteraceae bacterium]
MQEIFSILLKLMKVHSCVIIPDLGGFVMNAKPAVVDYASSYFAPPSKELLFNAHLVHNDGLLAHALMQEKHVSFEEATKQISDAVVSVKRALNSKGLFEVGVYGSFVQTEGGYSFRIGEMPVEDTTSFGLREFYFPLLEDGSTKSTPTSTNTKRSFPSFLVGSVAAIAAIMFMTQPVSDERHVDTANFAPMQLAEVVLPQKSYYLVMDKFSTEEAALSYGDSLSALLADSTQHFEVLRMEGEFLLAAQATKSLDKALYLKQDLSSYVQDSTMERSFVLGIYK